MTVSGLRGYSGSRILRTRKREKEEERKKIMLNKKTIAAFAAGATLVSGLAIAAPSIANAESSNSVNQNQNVNTQTDKLAQERGFG